MDLNGPEEDITLAGRDKVAFLLESSREIESQDPKNHTLDIGRRLYLNQ